MASCVHVSSRAMRLVRFAPVLALLALAFDAAAQIGPPRTQTYPFAVGAGGYWVTDNGRVSDVSAFSTRGWLAFGELVLESGVFLQIRYQAFRLPGTPVTPPFGEPTSAPEVDVRAGIASVGYLFREQWWDGGLVGGVGVYRLNPQTPTGDQTSTDVKETVSGWHGGGLIVFHVAEHWDVRLEADAYLLRTDANHKPITLGGAVAYHF